MSSNIRMNYSSYYGLMRDRMLRAEQEKNPVEAEYCAMHMLMAVENETHAGAETGSQKINIQDSDYKKMMSYIKSHEKRYKRYIAKNYLLSLLTGTILFYLFRFQLNFSALVSSIIFVTFITIDLLLNRMTEKKAIRNYEIRLFSKKVSSELLIYNQKLLVRQNAAV
jgi:hypothetical protein